jgi:hypothetical protein
MMIPDDVLAAYLDGELKGAERERIEQAIAQDAQLAQRVAQQQAQRDRVRGVFDSVLREAVPRRLGQAAKRALPDGPAQIIDLARVRAQRARRGNNGQRQLKVRRYSIAASLAVGLVGGALIQWLSAPAALTEIRDGSMLAHGALARALNEQLAGSPASAAQLRIGLTFRARSGNYCRTFTVSGNRALFGLACRAQQQLQVLTLLGTDSAAFTGGGSGGPGSVSAGSAGSAGPAGAGASVAGTTVVGANGQNPRLSASTLPPALLQAIDERISGEPLNAAAELKARNNGWH